jgi:hypothetical protein
VSGSPPAVRRLPLRRRYRANLNEMPTADAAAAAAQPAAEETPTKIQSVWGRGSGSQKV